MVAGSWMKPGSDRPKTTSSSNSSFPALAPWASTSRLIFAVTAGEAFRAFKSDRIFRFTIDDRGYEWGVAKITERELRRIAVVDGDGTLVLVRDGKAIELAADDVIELGETGTERLRVVELVTVTLNNEVEKKIPSGTYKTEELIRVLGVEAGYVLDVLNEHGKLEPLQPGQPIEVKAGMRFFSHVPAGGSS